MIDEIEDFLFGDISGSKRPAKSRLVSEMNQIVIDLVKTCQQKNTEIRQLKETVSNQQREIEFLRGMFAQLVKDKDTGTM